MFPDYISFSYDYDSSIQNPLAVFKFRSVLAKSTSFSCVTFIFETILIWLRVFDKEPRFFLAYLKNQLTKELKTEAVVRICS